MEINNHFSHLPRKDLTHSSPLGSPILTRPDLPQIMEQELQTQLLSLKHQQQMQQQMLLEQFHQQQQQLAHEHEKQMQEHIKMLMLQKRQELLEHQKKLEEQQMREKERLEQERLEQIKNKKKDEESAVASTEVKLKLQEFVLQKKHREAAANNMKNSPPQFRQWATQHSSLEQHSPPQSGLSPPYRPHHILGQYEDDFPLRKTASEPNLKVRLALKQKMIERRSSPLLRRKDRVPLTKRNTPLTIDTTVCNSNPDSGPNSPRSNSQIAGDATAQPNKEDQGTFPLQMMSKMVNQSGSDLLYTSPSMPNISVGLPHKTANTTESTQQTNKSLPNPSEAELRAMAAHRFGLPLTGHMLPSTLPFYPSLPVIDGEFTPPTSPAYITSQMKALEQARSNSKLPGQPMVAAPPYSVPNGSMGITDAQVAQARLHRHRPLGRTQSAPLPLGHPLLNQTGLLLQQQHEQIMKENPKLYLKQRIQSTVLQRSSSKTHMENVDEAAEARLAQEMKECREREDDDVVLISDSRLEQHQPQVQPPPPPPPPPPEQEQQQASELVRQQKEREAFLSQQREMMKVRHQNNMSSSPPNVIHHRPLSRTQSSPVVTFSLQQSPPPHESPTTIKHSFTTGLAYDNLMLKHQCTCGNMSNHPEHAGRLQSIWARLQETGLANRCERVKPRKASIEELQTCHGEAYTLLYGTSPLHRQKLDPKILEALPTRFCLLPCGGVGVDSDTVWNELHTSHAAKMATGCVIELAFKVAIGELKNGMALVRPPGHHAERDQAMGFCYFNSIAIAAKLLQERLKMEKIMILDWDVHHGNSTQQLFYDNPNVLYVSVHRHDNGNFFPGTGAPEECGVDNGLGYNVNIAWSGQLNPPMGDAEYMAAFRTVVIPVARDFAPSIILVSAGFDAALGHPPPLGGYNVSPATFGLITKQLMTLAGGKVVLVLEGGYDLPAICDASEICVQALLGDEVPPLKEHERRRIPNKPALDTLETTFKYQVAHWPCIKRYSNTLSYSLVEAQHREREEADTVSALASLSMVPEKPLRQSPCNSNNSTEMPMEES